MSTPEKHAIMFPAAQGWLADPATLQAFAERQMDESAARHGLKVVGPVVQTAAAAESPLTPEEYRTNAIMLTYEAEVKHAE